MQLYPLPEYGYRIFILLAAINYAVFAYLYETMVIEHLILTVRERWLKKHCYETDAYSLNEHEKILLSISSSPAWLSSAAEASIQSFELYPVSCTPECAENGIPVLEQSAGELPLS
ncbi:unnamed protein product [Gongylonema pulchrum]|uniref:Anoctamin n=1 Tax=Gongylonema pulchrum TaxID=637853 RepID=A0A183CVY6_9BILA|nr:unnamed protein product [Gongylonema pulchrum]